MSDSEKPKIIVDEDWKSQVEAEREALKQESTEDTPQSAGAAPDEAASLPPASFSVLVSTLATQALASMGQAPDPLEGKPVVRLALARHYIDTLGVLEEKTKGNLSSEEGAMLTGVLHELRMIFMAVQKNPPPAASSTDDIAGASG